MCILVHNNVKGTYVAFVLTFQEREIIQNISEKWNWRVFEFKLRDKMLSRF